MNRTVVPMSTITLTEEQGNNLLFAIISTSYEEYAMRCAVSGIEPTVSPVAFRKYSQEVFKAERSKKTS